MINAKSLINTVIAAFGRANQAVAVAEPVDTWFEQLRWHAAHAWYVRSVELNTRAKAEGIAELVATLEVLAEMCDMIAHVVYELDRDTFYAWLERRQANPDLTITEVYLDTVQGE